MSDEPTPTLADRLVRWADPTYVWQPGEPELTADLLQAAQALREADTRIAELEATPCPGMFVYGGGIGGRMLTTCEWCGVVMPSTAGPHPNRTLGGTDE